MGGTNTGRPSVSNPCTQEEELTGDKPTQLREGREGRVGSPLGNMASFFDLLSWQATCDHLM